MGILKCSHEPMFNAVHFQFVSQKTAYAVSVSDYTFANFSNLEIESGVYEELRQIMLHEGDTEAIKDLETTIKTAGWPKLDISNKYLAPPQQFFDTFPVLNKRVVAPCSHRDTIGFLRLSNVIMHLNDKCGWTREAIADWVDSLELDQEAKIDV